MDKAASPFQVRAQAHFHSSRGGASLLVHLTAHPRYPTHASLQAAGILHIHLQTSRTGARLEQTLVAYLARHLHLPPDRVAVAAGQGQPGKIMVMYDITPAELDRRLHTWLGAGEG